MNRPELTFEEFYNLPMQYMQGMTFDTGARRLFRNNEHGLQKEVFTKRNPRTQTWLDAKRFFFLDGDARQFTDFTEFYVAYMHKACSVPEPLPSSTTNTQGE